MPTANAIYALFYNNPESPQVQAVQSLSTDALLKKSAAFLVKIEINVNKETQNLE